MKKVLKKIVYLLLTLTSIFIIGITILTYVVNREQTHDVDYPKTEGNTVTFILVDGLSKAVFNEQLAAGNLPHLSKLMASSIYVKNGIGSFPSMTGYAYYPFITGVDATESGIYGLRWFDRSIDEGNLRNYVGRTNVYMDQDINSFHQNIFQLSGEQYTSSINSFMNKGVKHSQNTGWQHTTSKFNHIGLFKFLKALPFFGDRLVGDFFQHETYTMGLAKKQLKKNPKVQWVTLPSLDAMNHIHGMTDDYPKLLVHIDSLIGDYLLAIDELGQSDTRGIAIITDHGVATVKENINLVNNFNQQLGMSIERGESVHITTDELDIPLTEIAYNDGYLVVNGNLSNYLYFRDQSEQDVMKGWRNKLFYPQLKAYPTAKNKVNLIDFLTQQKGMGVVACQYSENAVWVQYQNQKALITKNDTGYQYQPIEGGDPLGYLSDTISKSMMDDQFHHQNQWLKNTFHSDYPDAVYRLYELMTKQGSGDVVICCLEGYDLAADYEIFVGNYKGGHGGLHANLLNVPYILYLPGQAPQELEYARAEEVGQWIKKFLFD